MEKEHVPGKATIETVAQGFASGLVIGGIAACLSLAYNKLFS